jgi:hypothetical protein
MLLKYELLGFAILYVVWTIYKAVMDWTDHRKEFDILLDECRAEWRKRNPLTEQRAPIRVKTIEKSGDSRHNRDSPSMS